MLKQNNKHHQWIIYSDISYEGLPGIVCVIGGGTEGCPKGGVTDASRTSLTKALHQSQRERTEKYNVKICG